ncbi:hypothetical protein BG000_010043 [Podila horticola]|nr:hypothetical protein BG000_010043 [Podila horticola]
MAKLDSITGFNIVTELLKKEYSKNAEAMEPRDLNLAKVSRAEKVYKALWNQVYPIFQVMSGRVHDKERALYELSYSSSGYVYCAGNEQLSYLAASIQSVRDVFKSNMPIQVFNAGDQDLSPSRKEYIRKMTTNIKVGDITQIFDNEYLQL